MHQHKPELSGRLFREWEETLDPKHKAYLGSIIDESLQRNKTPVKSEWIISIDDYAF